MIPHLGRVVRRQNAADNILVQLDPEAFGQLLCDLPTTHVRIASFEFNDCLDQVLSRPLRAGFVPMAEGIEPFEFEPCQCPMTTQQGGGFDEDGRAKEPARRQEERAQTKEEPIGEAKVWGASAGSTRD